MNGHRDWHTPEEHQPLTYVGGYPLYAAHVIVVTFVASMLASTIFAAVPALRFIPGLLDFTSDRVLAGEVWRVLTYGFDNPPSLWFVIDMAMVAFFGRELEKIFGRRIFLLLFTSLYLLPPLLFTAIGLVRPMALRGEAGSFALFIAFATLYPNAVMLFNILAKWLAIVLVALFSLMSLASNDWATLFSLWATTAFAFGFVRIQQGAITLPRFRLFRRKPKLRVLSDPVPKNLATPKAREDATMAEVDALLDKIAKSGIGSLTPKERAKLEAAREGLMKRGPARE